MKKSVVLICIVAAFFLIGCDQLTNSEVSEEVVTKLIANYLVENFDYIKVYPIGDEIKESQNNELKIEQITKISETIAEEEKVYIYQLEAKVFNGSSWIDDVFSFYISDHEGTLKVERGFKNESPKKDYIVKVKEEHDLTYYISNYLKEEYNYGQVYPIGEEIKAPKEGDIRLTELKKLQETANDSTVYGIFKAEYEMYYDNHWQEDFSLVVLSRPDSEKNWTAFVTEVYDDEKKQEGYLFTEKDIIEIKYNLRDIHASFKFTNNSTFIGIGSDVKGLELEEVKEREAHSFNVYEEGDYWVTYFYQDMTAACYYNKQRDKTSILSVDIKRGDIITYDGVKIGDSYEAVDTVYSKLDDFYLIEKSYNHIVYAQMKEGLGIHLDFEFVDGKLSVIKFYDYFD